MCLWHTSIGVQRWRVDRGTSYWIGVLSIADIPPAPFWLLALALGAGGCSCGDDNGGGAGGPFGPGADAGDDSDLGTAPIECLEGRVICQGDMAMVCDGEGGFAEAQDCEADGKACVASRLSATGEVLTLGCVECMPGERSCADDTGRLCREDGSGFDVFHCDPLQGMVCAEEGCTGACAPPEVTTSYIGCDYYPTVTLNPVWSGFDYAIAVSNASNAPAQVTITRDGDTVRELAVGVDALEVITLDWVEALKGGDQDACQVPPEPGNSRLVEGGAYRLRSDRPVTVYQLSPLQYQREEGGGAPAECPVGIDCPGGIVAECLSYSNDASLLLPATTLSGDYTVMSWPSRGNTASFFTITATEDGTVVTLEGRGSFRPGGGVERDGSGEVAMNRGDVLQVLASHGDDEDDASGSVVRADKPVQVIGGHSCANVPTPMTGACDHLEQALFPTQILGSDYVVSYPAAVASESPHVVRIAAVEADTRVSFEPAVADEVVLQPGQAPFELRIGAADAELQDVRVTSDKPIAVAQYMQGQTSVPSGAGDPSMSMAVPVEQYRSEYIFTASDTYDANFINVIAPIGTVVSLDGEELEGDRRDVGDSDLEVTRYRLAEDGPDVHRISAGAPFGLVVYGYGRFTSYMYPGGLDLKRITVVRPE